jgi:hypothetical protein
LDEGVPEGGVVANAAKGIGHLFDVLGIKIKAGISADFREARGVGTRHGAVVNHGLEQGQAETLVE